MAGFNEGIYEIGRLDRFAMGESAVHRIDPRAKVLTTLVFIVCVVSFGKYEVLAMAPFLIYPVVLASEGGVPLSWLAGRLAAAAPFALVVGVFNPLIDTDVIARMGSLGLTGGWISYLSIIARFILTTAAALTLIATTSFNGVCVGLQRLGVPDVFATQLLFLYRYIFVLAEEALTMQRARDLRSFGRNGRGIHVFGQMLGHLLLRTYARAERIYSAMLCRGFDGTVRVRGTLRIRPADVVFTAGWCAAFMLFRFVNVPLVMGGLLTGVLT